jgi:hypothetical protein
MSARSRTEDLAQQSQFAFQGTVQRLHATTMSDLPATDRTVVVRVDQVIHAPESLGDWTGKEITVQLGRVRRMEEALADGRRDGPWRKGRVGRGARTA